MEHPESQPMTRRAALVGAVAGLAIGPAALAGLIQPVRNNRGGGGQPPRPAGGQPAAPGSTPPKEVKPSVLDKYLLREKQKDWTLRATVYVQAYTDTDGNGMPRVIPLSFSTAAVVFPILKSSASHEVFTPEVTGKLYFNDQLEDDSITYLDNYQSGTRLGRWEMKDKTGREFKLEVNIPVRCYDTVFDESAASEFPWPKGSWGAAAASTLAPQPFVDYSSALIAGLVQDWTGGKDPRTVKPVRLAKFLMGRVLEYAQPSGNGEAASDNGKFEGLALQSASITADLKKGSEHDIAVLLCAVYRAAGLPSRTVIGYDTRDSRGDNDQFLGRRKRGGQVRSWVEFCLYDEDAGRELWVPVDVARLRKSSSRAPNLDKPWKFFGTHDELHEIIPFAFQYHPPTTVVAHGSVAFWGWFTTPEVQIAEQYLDFLAMSTPSRGTERTPSADPNPEKAPAPAPKRR